MATGIKSILMEILPSMGIAVVVVLFLMIFIGIGVVFIIKFRHRIFANAKALMFTINDEGSVLGLERLWGKVDKDNSLREVYFRDIEETLSIENVLPVRLGKHKYYIIAKYMDGTHKIVNPKVDKNLLVLDNRQLDYKRWFATIVPQIYESTHKEELQKATQKVMFMVIAGVIGTAAIFAVGIWGATKLGIISLQAGYGSINAFTGALNAFANNLSVIR